MADGSVAAMMPKEADSFVDAIGVDSHFNYNGSPYVQMWPVIRDELVSSGIRHIRDGGRPNPEYLSRLTYLGEHGIKHAAGFDIDVTPEYIRKTLLTYAPFVDFVEPANEYDHHRTQDPNWALDLAREQQVLYNAVRADPSFHDVTVLGPALATQPLYNQLGNLEMFEDAANIHNATCNRNPGTNRNFGIAAISNDVRASTPTKPIWTTETGYTDDPSRGCAIPDDIIAKYDPRTVAERFNYGEPKIYFYQLADMPSDIAFGALGLLDADGRPKPQFTALKSLISLISDRGPDFPVKPLAISIENAPDALHHTLLEKRSGTYELLLWLEVPTWKPISANNVGGVRIPVQSASITAHVPDVSAAKYYTYDSNWQLSAAPIQISDGHIQLNVTDSISVLELK